MTTLRRLLKFLRSDPRRDGFARKIREARRSRDAATDWCDRDFYQNQMRSWLEFSRIACKPRR